MKIVIDEKVCLKHKMTVEEVLLSLFLRMCKTPLQVRENLKNREILVNQGINNDYYVTQHWSDVLDEILCDSSGGIDSEERLLALAKKMRDAYPEGKMKNRFGQLTPYYYRCNTGEIVKKLKKFFLVYGNVSDDDILDATRRYVASFNGNYNGSLRLLKYFILKDDVKPGEDGAGHVEQVSDLATFLENRESGEEVDSNDDSWLMTSRN